MYKHPGHVPSEDGPTVPVARVVGGRLLSLIRIERRRVQPTGYNNSKLSDGSIGMGTGYEVPMTRILGPAPSWIPVPMPTLRLVDPVSWF